MWTCPKCETLNDGEFCVVCGEAKPVPAARPEPEKAAYTPAKEKPVNTTANQAEDVSKYIKRTSALINDADKELEYSGEEKKKSYNKWVVISIIAALILIQLIKKLFML